MKLSIALTVVLLGSPALAQPRNVQLALTRICISEASFQLRHSLDEYSSDCAAITEVLRNRSATGRVTMGIMRAYSPNSFDKQRTDSRRWIAWLRADGRQPRYWPATASWSAHKPRFLEVYHLVGQLLRKEVKAPCSAHHWGADVPAIHARAARWNWHITECNSVNLFFTPARFVQEDQPNLADHMLLVLFSGKGFPTQLPTDSLATKQAVASLLLSHYFTRVGALWALRVDISRLRVHPQPSAWIPTSDWQLAAYHIWRREEDA